MDNTHRGGFRPHFCKFHCNIWLYSKIITKLKYIFLKVNCDSDLKITSLTFKSPDFNPLDYHVSMRYTRQNRPTLPSWRLSCHWYGMICYRSSLIRQSCHFEIDFDRVLLQLADTLNTQFKHPQSRAADFILKRLESWQWCSGTFGAGGTLGGRGRIPSVMRINWRK